nr:hypothetical protein Iba_chr10bCG4180 [Ipomoea batatas]GMD43095.1 hypothetical protein Iba_chr10cCG1990 [Ipomoea batatas]GMD48038.1 hypothetical protein Iba_chr10fCG2580 [Ipomoea batatas]
MPRCTWCRRGRVCTNARCSLWSCWLEAIFWTCTTLRCSSSELDSWNGRDSIWYSRRCTHCLCSYQ